MCYGDKCSIPVLGTTHIFSPDKSTAFEPFSSHSPFLGLNVGHFDALDAIAQTIESATCEPLLIRAERVSLHFSECLMADRGGDLVGRAASFRQALRKSLAHTVRRAV